MINNTVKRIEETSMMSENQKYVLSLFKNDGIPADLDLSDDKQYQFLIDLRGGKEYLETYFPHRFKLLENSRHIASNAPKVVPPAAGSVIGPGKLTFPLTAMVGVGGCGYG